MLYPPLTCSSLGDPGGSAYYRVVMPLFMANQKGHIQLRMPQKMYFYPVEYIRFLKPDTMLFHRTHTDPQRKYMNEIAHEGNIQLVYTIDDWVSKVPKESPHFKDISPTADKEIKKAIGFCDKLIVTNDTLASVYGYKKDTYVVPNYLSQMVWERVYATVRKPRDNDKIRIGWSGGIGHPGDLRILREIADALGNDIQWVFLGDIPPGFDQGNSEVHVAVPPPNYPIELYKLDLDLALAPLLDNDFNRAKSNLRVLEYGACGYPVIASNVEAYRGCPVPLMDYNANWWVTQIKQFIEDREKLKSIGENLKEWVWNNHRLEDHLVDYANILAPDGVGFVPTDPEIEDTIDIVITTHNSKEVVKNCVDSVLESIPAIKSKVEVIVTDNASDESGMQDYLQLLEKGGITVLHSDQDQGYVKNVNKGLCVHPNRDAIILNSDTFVEGDWVDRLRAMAYSDERIGSVTPWTNNGTIVSYPNPQTSTMEPALVRLYDSVASETKYDTVVELPTPVGFCTFLKRKALADVGLFDPHGFGRGYGDENDWALRAYNRIWKNVLGYDTYVGHVGTASFKEEKKALLEESARTLMIRFPDYNKMIERWMQSNPLQALRQQLDIQTIEKTASGNKTLYIAHGFGGGLETYLQSQLSKDHGAVILRNEVTNPGMALMEIEGEKYFNLPTVSTRLTAMSFLKEMFLKFGVNKISIQTTFGYDYNFPIWIMNLAKMMNVPYEIMLHDYWTICPRLRLIQTSYYCGEPAVEDCNQCVVDYGSGVGQVDVGEWRSMYHKLLKGASHVYAPSKDLADRIKKHFSLKVEVVSHEPKLQIGSWKSCVKKWQKGKEDLRVAVIGNISPDKGSLIVEKCSLYCLENNIPLKFVVFGNLIDNSAVLKMLQPNDKLSIVGPYEEQDISVLLNLNACHISFFGAIWPETWSYTLSHAFRAGLWPVAFDIGAIGERIKATGFGHLLPFEQRDNIPAIVECLLAQAEKYDCSELVR